MEEIYKSPETVFGNEIIKFIKTDGFLSEPRRKELAASVIMILLKAAGEEQNKTKKLEMFLSVAELVQATTTLALVSVDYFEAFQESLGEIRNLDIEEDHAGICKLCEIFKILCQVGRKFCCDLFRKEIEQVLVSVHKGNFRLEEKVQQAAAIASLLSEVLECDEDASKFVLGNMKELLDIGRCLQNVQNAAVNEARLFVNVLQRAQEEIVIQDRTRLLITAWAAEFLAVKEFEALQDEVLNLIKVVCRVQ